MRYAAIAIVVALLLGCAHGTSPIDPASPAGGSLSNIAPSAQSAGKVLWGLYNITLDPVTESAEIVPLRGIEFKANVTRFVQPPIGKAFYLSFNALDFTDFPTEGIVRLDVGLTHPFPGLDRYRGFDVMGVFMSNASYYSSVDTGAVLPDTDGSDARLLNADGYTRWNNATEFFSPTIFGFEPGIFGTPNFSPTGTVNGYKYFCDDLTEGVDVHEFFSEPPNIENRGSFMAGGVNYRDYEIKFPDPDGQLLYQYAILASWVEPSNLSNPTLDDFPAIANQAEPWLMAADTSESSVFYEDADNKGGSLHVDLSVYDWQQWMNGEEIINAASAIRVESFSPGFIEGGAIDVLSSATASPDTIASSVISFDIASVNPTASGDEYILVTFENADPNSYDQDFSVPISDGVLSSYLITTVTVKDENPINQAPSVGAISGEQEPMEIDVEEYTVAALDPEGDTLHYSWSLVADGDPVNWGNVGEDAATIAIDWNDYGYGEYDLYARVKDDFNNWQDATNNPYGISVIELNITCGDGTFGYFDYAYTQCQQTEAAILSDGTVIAEYGYSFTPREFEVMQIWYGWHQPGYCGQTNYEDECDDTWCELYKDLYTPDTDPTNRSIHMDTDYAGTYGAGYETDDVVAFVMLNQSSIVRFLGGFNTANESPATQLYTRTIPTGTIIAIDFDEDGDLWILDSTGEVYELVKDDNYVVTSPEFDVDMDTLTPDDVVVFDWAISYLNGDFYCYTDETVGGTLHRISGSTGTITTTVSNALDAGVTNPSYGLGTTGARGDVEIDHRIMTDENPLAENCRIVVGGGPGGTDTAAMFARYDQALNLLSTWDNNKEGGGDCHNYVGNDGSRFIIFDPVEHVDDPLTDVNEFECRHTMWAGDAGTSAGNLIWASSCRPIPDDWDGW